MKKFKKLIFFGDFLSSVTSTSDFIFEIISVPVRQAMGLSLDYGISLRNSISAKFDLNKFKKLANVACEESPEILWSSTFHEMPQDAVEYIISKINSDELFFCFDMPPWLEKLFNTKNISYIDIRISPINFGSDLYVAINSNDEDIKSRLEVFSVPEQEIYLEASIMGANVRAHLKRLKEGHRHQIPDLENTIIYVPQDPKDKSLLLKNGKYLEISCFPDVIEEKARGRRILVLADYSNQRKIDNSKRDREFLKNLFGKNISFCTQNFYQILASHADIEVMSINSPFNQEASWFGKKAHNFAPFYTPIEKNNIAGNYLQTYFRNILSPSFWHLILDSECQQPMVKDLSLSNTMHYGRAMLDCWGEYEKVINWERVLPYGGFQRSGGIVLKQRVDTLEKKLIDFKIKKEGDFKQKIPMQSRIQSLKDTKKGEDAYILGNAASLMNLNVNELMKRESFWFNKSFSLKDLGFDFKPKYYFMRDVAGAQMWLNDVISIEAEIKFFGREAFNFIEKTNPECLAEQNILCLDVQTSPGTWMYEDESNFSYDPSETLFSGFTSVLDAVQVAYYMGYDNVFIGGVDLDYNIPYFHGEIPANINGMQDFITDRMRKSFLVARKVFEKNGRTLAKITESPHLPLEYIEPAEILLK